MSSEPSQMPAFSFDSALAIPFHPPPPPPSPADIITSRAQAVETVSTEIYNTLTFRNQCCQKARLSARLSVCLPLSSLLRQPLLRFSNRPSSLRDQSTHTVSSQDRPSHSLLLSLSPSAMLVHRMRHHAGVSKKHMLCKEMQVVVVSVVQNRPSPPPLAGQGKWPPIMPRAPMPFAPLPFASIPSIPFDGEQRRV